MVKVKEIKNYALVATSASQSYLPEKLIDKLVAANVRQRDLRKRLSILPSLPKGRNIGTESGSISSVIKFAEKLKMQLYYGYFVRVDGDDVQLIRHAFCVDKGKVVEVSKHVQWDAPCYYLGIPIPANDIPSRKFELNFERMDYLLKQFEVAYVR